MSEWRIVEGECVAAMKDMGEASVDAVVCDPPYGLQFMGKEWDAMWRNQTDADRAYVERTAAEGDGLTARRRNLPDLSSDADKGRKMQAWHETWATQALRALKPGGYLLAFGGSRTYHRLAAAVEDAGFEVRDCIMWLYASGFPKSHNLSGDHEGWGTALKPAWESVVVARKPRDLAGISGIMAHEIRSALCQLPSFVRGAGEPLKSSLGECVGDVDSAL